MEEASILLSIAEVGVGLAGFGGIAAGIGYRVSGKWLEHDRVRITWLILYSLAAVFSCFVPFAIFHLGVSEPWLLASCLLVVICLAALRTLIRIVTVNSGNGYSRPSIMAMVLIQLITLAVLLCILLGFTQESTFGFYLCAVLLNLLQAAFLFLRLLSTGYIGEAVGHSKTLRASAETDEHDNNSERLAIKTDA